MHFQAAVHGVAKSQTQLSNWTELNLCISIAYWVISSVQSLSCVWLFTTPWTAAHQASLSITNSWSLLKLMSIWVGDTIQTAHPLSSVRFSSHLQSFPESRSFQMRQFLASGGQSIGISALASVLLMNIQGWFPLGWTGWISLIYSFPDLEPVCCSMSGSNCCFLTCIQISQEASQVVWYSHFFKNFPQFCCDSHSQRLWHSQ